VAPVPRAFEIGRYIEALRDDLRFARVILTREARDDDMEWHQVGTTGEPSFGTNWSNYGGGFYPLQFARHPLEQVLLLRGAVACSSLVDARICTLPAGYRPAVQFDFYAGADTDFLGMRTGPFFIDELGNLVYNSPGTIGNPTRCYFDGLEFPLPA
jgi:hypothetical protein